MGLTVAASTDGAPFGDITELQWCVFLETGEQAVSYRVEGLTTERAQVLGELYRRAGCWRLRAVGQGWEGGLAGLATDYGVSIAADEPEPVDQLDFEIEAGPTEEAVGGIDVPTGDDRIVEPDEQVTASMPVESAAPTGDESVGSERGPSRTTRAGGPIASAAKVRIAAVKTAAVPVMRLADDASWQASRLFSIAGIGGVDEQEKRATSALLWAMSAVRPLGRALTGRAAA